MDKVILNSLIDEESVELYKGVRIVGSKINRNCIVGDFSRITESILDGFNRVDRNSLIYYSTFELYSYVGMNSVIMHSDIGKFCSLSWGVTIGPGNHDYSRISSHDFLYNNFYNLNSNEVVYNRFEQRTVIGNDVWIGTNVTVVNGVKIGHGAVIGANTIVTKDVPPYAIVVGNPGRILKYRFDEETIEELLDLKWWDLEYGILKDNFKVFKSESIQECIKSIKRIKK